MILDVNRIRPTVTLEINRWLQRKGSDNLIKVVESVVSSAGSPLIETAILVKEITGGSPELDDFITRTMKWYRVTKIIGSDLYAEE